MSSRGLWVLLLLLAMGWVVSSCATRSAHPQAESEWKPQVKMTKLPVFPDSLIKLGITRGNVQAVVVLSEEGVLVDWLVTEATHWEFANAIGRVIERWDFEGARSPREPGGEAFGISVDFEAVGTIKMTAGPHDMSDHLFGAGFDPASDAIRLATPADLDGLPLIRESVMPRLPADLAGSGPWELIFEFYIGTDGSVHIPVLKSSSADLDERLIFAAQDALWSWKYYPPTVNGRPVVAKVSLPLHFSSSSEKARNQ